MFILFISLFLISVDLYTFKGVRKLVVNWPAKGRYALYIFYWLIPLVVIGFVVYISQFTVRGSDVLSLVQFSLGFFVLFYLPKFVFNTFHFIEDIAHLLAKLTRRLSPPESSAAVTAKKISRSDFLTRIGTVAAVIPFISIANGIWRGRFDFTVRRHTLNFPNLPPAFDGIKIVQISDFHIGSFAGSREEVDQAVDLINQQQPDLLLFTGDMVNNVAAEMDAFVSALGKLRAPLGKFSVLGNHDYGDYYRWNSNDQKQQNLQQLKDNQQAAGFKLLLNESFHIEKDNQQVALIGVENWGLPPFPKYGDLNQAQNGSADSAFKILLSHDPTHWSAEVLEKTDIDLTLSGHTHGMQFGIEIPGWRWSPVNLRYDHWGGLYQEGKQYLYVNTGIGFIAFPGRVGMPPEITVLELKNGKMKTNIS